MSEAPPPPPPEGGAAPGGAEAAAAEAGEAPPQGEEEAGSKTTPPAFYEAKHVAFIRGLMDKTDSFEHVVMEHLKVPRVQNGGSNLIDSVYLDPSSPLSPPSLPPSFL